MDDLAEPLEDNLGHRPGDQAHGLYSERPCLVTKGKSCMLVLSLTIDSIIAGSTTNNRLGSPGMPSSNQQCRPSGTPLSISTSSSRAAELESGNVMTGNTFFGSHNSNGTVPKVRRYFDMNYDLY